MEEQEVQVQGQTRVRESDASVKTAVQDMAQQQQQQMAPPPQGPLLPPIQQTPSHVTGHDQNTGNLNLGPMQASSSSSSSSPRLQHQQQQTYAMHPPQQQQQPQQSQTLPPPQSHTHSHAHTHTQSQAPTSHAQQSPIINQPRYEPPPQQNQYVQQSGPPPPPPAQHHSHHQPPPPPPQQHQQPQQQQQQQSQYELPPPQANGAPPGYAPAQQIAPPHHNQYQYQQPQPQYQQPPPPPPLNGDANGYRYSLPIPPSQTNGQQLSSARHKKEIKRRTKTGCLTCRKRRIKCDEGHPTCRNCQKSKRECLGYDPIFKAQTGQTANIQPQPGVHLPPQDSQSPQLAPPLVHQQYSNVPQGYMPASSAGYAPAPNMQTQLEQAYEYGNAIDPALAAGHAVASHAPPPPMPPPQEQYTTILLPERNVRLIAMDDVYHIDGIPPSFPAPRDINSQQIPQHEIDGIRDLYLREYAPGLDRFFETDWYGTQGINVLMTDNDLLHYFAHCLDRFRQPPSENNRGLPSIEARLVWKLASMAFYPPQDLNRPPLPFLPRIEAVSHIILGTFMAPENVPLVPTHIPDMKTQPDAYTFYLQDLFWHHLSSFTAIRDDSVHSTTSGQDIANHLAGMRNILSMLENRDVLYSMAIARHFGGRMEHYDADKLLVGRGAEAEDPINKLSVAMSFLADEEVQGTTQVVQRLCGMMKCGFQLQRPTQPSALVGYEKAEQKNDMDAHAGAQGGVNGDAHGHQGHQDHQDHQDRQDHQDHHHYEDMKHAHPSQGGYDAVKHELSNVNGAPPQHSIQQYGNQQAPNHQQQQQQQHGDPQENIPPIKYEKDSTGA